VLVNPGVPVATKDVFRALGRSAGETRAHEPMNWAAQAEDREALLGALGSSANDLEAPAQRVAPVLGTLLQRLANLSGCRLARMSGSGATCFAVFDDCRASAAAGRALTREEPCWWVKATILR
jgi:4-diphosphocytidyl-2-C-methyl-D-erythritol kinase